jgi:hypothetical protein
MGDGCGDSDGELENIDEERPSELWDTIEIYEKHLDTPCTPDTGPVITLDEYELSMKKRRLRRTLTLRWWTTRKRHGKLAFPMLYGPPNRRNAMSLYWITIFLRFHRKWITAQTLTVILILMRTLVEMKRQ